MSNISDSWIKYAVRSCISSWFQQRSSTSVSFVEVWLFFICDWNRDLYQDLFWLRSGVTGRDHSQGGRRRMSSLSFMELCRLCLVKERVSIPIFEGEGDVRQILLKIAACLPVKVSVTHAMSEMYWIAMFIHFFFISYILSYLRVGGCPLFIKLFLYIIHSRYESFSWFVLFVL